MNADQQAVIDAMGLANQRIDELKALNAELVALLKRWQHSHCRCQRCLITRVLIAKAEGKEVNQ